MGIYFTHTQAQWSYIGFSHFRQALAAREGFDLHSMRGFGSDREWSTVNTPLEPFLNHSDCDGELTPAQCRQVAPRLRELVDELWPEGVGDIGSAHNRQSGLALADGMDAAAAGDEPLEFT